MQSKQKSVAVIIVGLNACRYVEECLHSLEDADWNDFTREIIYIDNGSKDDTLKMLEQFNYVKVIANPTNLGFCKAANQGAKVASSHYYFFLNDDTLVLNDAIPKLIDFLHVNEDAGVVGSRLLNTDLSEQWSGRKFPTLMNAIMGRRAFLSKLFPNSASLRTYLCKDELNSEQPFVVDWVSAAALLVEQDLFHKVGGFAEDYYYWHEAVFCDRIKKLGKLSYLHPASKIIHHEGKGSGARPLKTVIKLTINFHSGAYRAYLEHHNISIIHPLSLIAMVGLISRAAILVFIASIKGYRRH